MSNIQGVNGQSSVNIIREAAPPPPPAPKAAATSQPSNPLEGLQGLVNQISSSVHASAIPAHQNW